MTEDQIKYAAEAIYSMRTRKESKPYLKTDERYKRRLEIDQVLTDQRLKEKEVWEEL